MTDIHGDLFLDNAYTAQFDVEGLASTTGEDAPLAGLVTLEVWFSATKGGAAIHADLRATLIERSGTPGRYYALFSGVTLRTHLATIAASATPFVWRMFGDSTNVLQAKRFIVRANRPG